MSGLMYAHSAQSYEYKGRDKGRKRDGVGNNYSALQLRRRGGSIHAALERDTRTHVTRIIPAERPAQMRKFGKSRSAALSVGPYATVTVTIKR